MPPSRDRWGARAAGTALLLLLALRALTALSPTMWGWGLNAQRFLPPSAAWLPWAASALLLLRGPGAAAVRGLERAGGTWAGGGRATWLAFLGGALLVWALPDRSWFTGDFLLRQGAAETGAVPGTFAQALPLERFLHRTLPLAVGGPAAGGPNVVARVLGALAAGATAAAALALARSWGAGGAAAAAVAATGFLGGQLVVFTGLGKPAAVLCALFALATLGATRLAATGRGGVLLGLAVGAALLTHRAGVALIPLWLAGLALAWRARRDGRGPSGAGFLLAMALPAAAAVFALPLVAGIVRDYDLGQHLMTPAARARGPLAAALAPLHLLDLANLLLFYTPALLPAAALLAARARRTRFGAADLLAALPAAAMLPLLLFVHPGQGIVRDLDVFAPAGLALSLVAARALGAGFADGALPRWLAAPLIAAVAMPALQWLLLFHHPERGLDRASALALEAPARPDDQRARFWDALAYRAFRERRWDRALEATGHAARLAPHPRALTMLAIARTYGGDHRGAESLYVVLAERTPEDPLVWLGLGGAALRAGDSLQAARALSRLRAYPPDGREARLIRRHLRVFPEVWPAGGEGVAGEGAAPGR